MNKRQWKKKYDFGAISLWGDWLGVLRESHDRYNTRVEELRQAHDEYKTRVEELRQEVKGQ